MSYEQHADAGPTRRRCEPPRNLPSAICKRRPARSILTALGVALAVGSFITLYGLSRSVQENVQQSFEERGTDLTVRRRGIAEPFGGTMPEAIIPEIAKIPGVAAVSGQLLSFAATDNDDHVHRLRLGRGQLLLGRRVLLLEGRLPQPGRAQGRAGRQGYRAHARTSMSATTSPCSARSFIIIGITNYTSIINRNAVIVETRRPAGGHVPHRSGDLHRGQAGQSRRPGGEADRIAKAIEGLGEFSVTRSEGVLQERQPDRAADAVSQPWPGSLSSWACSWC